MNILNCIFLCSLPHNPLPSLTVKHYSEQFSEHISISIRDSHITISHYTLAGGTHTLQTAASPTSTWSFCWHSLVSFSCFTNRHRVHAITNGNGSDTAPRAVFLGLLGLGTTMHIKYLATAGLIEILASYTQACKGEKRRSHNVPMSVLSWDFGHEANGTDLLCDHISVVVLIVVSLFTALFLLFLFVVPKRV